jgi:hypothetical protein
MIYEYGELWWNDIDRGKWNDSEKNLLNSGHVLCTGASNSSENATH